MTRTAVELAEDFSAAYALLMDTRSHETPMDEAHYRNAFGDARAALAALDAEVAALAARVAEYAHMADTWMRDRETWAQEKRDLSMRVQEMESPRSPNALELAEAYSDARATMDADRDVDDNHWWMVQQPDGSRKRVLLSYADRQALRQVDVDAARAAIVAYDKRGK